MFSASTRPHPVPTEGTAAWVHQGSSWLVPYSVNTVRDPDLLLRSRASICLVGFFSILPGQTPGKLHVLGTAVETGAPLAGVLLYQCADSDVSVLWQSVQVLSVSSTQQELAVIEKV